MKTNRSWTGITIHNIRYTLHLPARHTPSPPRPNALQSKQTSYRTSIPWSRTINVASYLVFYCLPLKNDGIFRGVEQNRREYCDKGSRHKQPPTPEHARVPPNRIGAITSGKTSHCKLRTVMDMRIRGVIWWEGWVDLTKRKPIGCRY